MKVLIINEVCGYGSTGKICAKIAENYTLEGTEVKIAYGRNGIVPEEYKEYAVRIGNDLDVKMHALKTRIFDAHGFGSTHATRKFIKWVGEYRPDLIWLHNLHGYYINVELLFGWLKENSDIQVRWTLHDCWAFTGHCSHFTVVNCDKWKTHCELCPQKREYPKSYILDRSYANYNRKKRAFLGVQNMTIEVVSKWLADRVKQSFLNEYPIEVVLNKIDESIFKPTPSDFREKNGLEGKKVILGVAGIWSASKGLEDFVQLSKLLPDEYQIVLVGVSEKQKRIIPSNILTIARIENQRELAKIYSAADVYVNTSKEETFGLTTIEAASCGAAVVVYEGTACEEVACANNGHVVKQDINSLYEAIIGII